MARLENEVTRHGEEIQSLRTNTAGTERNLQNLLVAVDSFCDRATRQMERLPAPDPGPGRRSPWWRIAAVAGGVILIGGAALFFGVPEFKTSANPVSQVPRPEPPKVPPSGLSTEAPAPRTTQPGVPVVVQSRPPKTATGEVLKLDVKANEASWVGIYENDKLTFAKVMEAGQTKTVESSAKVRVQLGNAGGVEISLNGKPIGPVGPRGQIRIVELTPAGFQIVPRKPPTLEPL